MKHETVPVLKYVETRFDLAEKAVSAALAAQERLTAAALAAAERAVAKSDAASDKRFDGVNEFRASLNDFVRLMMPRAEAEQIFRALTEKIDMLTNRVNSRDDRGKGLNQGWVLLIASVSGIGTLVAIAIALAQLSK